MQISILDVGLLLTPIKPWSLAIVLFPPGIAARALYSLILSFLIAGAVLRYLMPTPHGARIALISATVLFGLSSIISLVSLALSGGIVDNWKSFTELLSLELLPTSVDLEHNLWKLLFIDSARFSLMIVPLASIISSWLLFGRGKYRLALLANLVPLINIVTIAIFSF